MTEKAEPITPFERPRRLYLLVILIVGVVAALIVAGIILALAQP